MVEQQQGEALAVVLPGGLKGLCTQQPKIFTEEAAASPRAQAIWSQAKDTKRGIRVKKPGFLVNLGIDEVAFASVTPQIQWNVQEKVEMCTVFDAQGCASYTEISQRRIREFPEGKILADKIVLGVRYSPHDVKGRQTKAIIGNQVMYRATPKGAEALYTQGGKGSGAHSLLRERRVPEPGTLW